MTKFSLFSLIQVNEIYQESDGNLTCETFIFLRSLSFHLIFKDSLGLFLTIKILYEYTMKKQKNQVIGY